MLACPDDSKTALPVCEFLPNTIPANHFQPPLVQFDPSPILAGGDAATLLAGGVTFGFACGMDAAILAYAMVGTELKFLAFGCALALAALIGIQFFVTRRKGAANLRSSE